MGKHTDAIGSLEDYQAPWETAAGETEIDKAKLKRYIFGLVTDKAKAQDARDESAEKVTEAEQALETAKAEVAKGDPSGKIAGLEKELAKAKDDLAKTQGNLDRIEVGLEAGLTVKQAQRLQGETREELEADAKEILETFGVQKATTDDDDGDDEGDEDDADNLRRTPRLVNPADRTGGKPEQEPDYEKIADQIASRRF